MGSDTLNWFSSVTLVSNDTLTRSKHMFQSEPEDANVRAVLWSKWAIESNNVITAERDNKLTSQTGTMEFGSEVDLPVRLSCEQWLRLCNLKV